MFGEKFIELLNQVEQFSVINNGQIWYRGTSKNTYKLHSSLFRLHYPSISDYLNLEEQQLHYLSLNAQLLNIQCNEYEEIDSLYYMQHYGLKTRLLDWTSSLSVALYFLSNQWTSDTNPRLWLLNPSKLNTISVGTEGIISPCKYTLSKLTSLTSSIGISPIRNNNRIIAQQGFFTVQSNSLKPLDEEFGKDLCIQNALTYFDLDYTLKQDVLNYLTIHSINPLTIFPDINGLKDYIDSFLIPESAK